MQKSGELAPTLLGFGEVSYPNYNFLDCLYSKEPSSTLGEQKQTNPFLQVTSLESFLGFMGA